MSTKKSAETDGRYSEICGAENRAGEPCGLPAGWGTPGSGGKRCKFHGGASTGPDSTEHLENNDYAEGNPGGGAPEGNRNAEIHGGFGDWEAEYDRLDEDTRETVDRFVAETRERVGEYAPEVSKERRERLLKEWATLSILRDRAHADVFGTGEDGRGFMIEVEREIDGETVTVTKPNPANRAVSRIRTRRREIAKELRLRPWHRDE